MVLVVHITVDAGGELFGVPEEFTDGPYTRPGNAGGGSDGVIAAARLAESSGLM